MGHGQRHVRLLFAHIQQGQAFEEKLTENHPFAEPMGQSKRQPHRQSLQRHIHLAFVAGIQRSKPIAHDHPVD